jgi:hypothetical protein
MGNRNKSKPGTIDPRKVRAAYLFIFKQQTEPQIGAEFGVTDRTIRLWKASEQWPEACMEALKLYGPELIEVGMGRLIASAKGEPGGPGVRAAEVLLERSIGKVTDKHELTGAGGRPLAVTVVQLGPDDHGAGNHGALDPGVVAPEGD